MEYALASLGLLGFLGLIGWFVWRWFHHAGSEILISRAREAFRLQRERLELQFFEAAARSGKPRGLRWKNCEFNGELALARERGTGGLVGLLPVTIAFEAIEGGDMEGLAAVGNLRQATAVFSFKKGHWLTTGRAVFNLNPEEALKHFHNAYDRIENQKTAS